MLLPHTQVRRSCAVVLALCYIWLSVAGTFLHECMSVPAPSSQRGSTSIPQTKTRYTQDAHALSHAQGAHSCFVCKWEAANVSPALPVFEVLPSFTLQQRVTTTFPRYLKTVTFYTSSRAPPLA